MDITIETMQAGDYEAVAAIYEEGIATGNATFDQQAPSWKEWDASHLPQCRLIARIDGRAAGWAALSPVSNRCVYGGVAEISVYVAAFTRGRGLGQMLLRETIRASETARIWTLEARIFAENTPSIKMCEACGFRIVGRRERLGQHNGVWRDVMLLERRSSIVGV